MVSKDGSTSKVLRLADRLVEGLDGNWLSVWLCDELICRDQRAESMDICLIN